MSGSELYGDRIPTAREQRVIELVAKGLKNKEVGDAIGKSENYGEELSAGHLRQARSLESS